MSEKINLHTWFTDRELNFCPSHFVLADTNLKYESHQWILENLTGRFCLIHHYDSLDLHIYPAFEDPSEATYFQLIWK